MCFMCFMHIVVNNTAPSYLVEILSYAVNIDIHYKVRNDNNDLDQFHLRTEKKLIRKSLFPDYLRK